MDNIHILIYRVANKANLDIHLECHSGPYTNAKLVFNPYNGSQVDRIRIDIILNLRKELS